MKKILLSLFCVMVGLTVKAGDLPNGFYRIQNTGSERWMHLVDDEGSVDWGATTVDLHALALYNASSVDPLSTMATVLYIENISDNEYNIIGQGINFKELFHHTVTIRKSSPTDNTYYIYGTYQGAAKYIADFLKKGTRDSFTKLWDGRYPELRQWTFHPVNSTDNYVGVEANIASNGKYYTDFCVSFPYKLPTGMKAYYFARIGRGSLEKIEISGIIPPGLPVVLESPYKEASKNKLELVNNFTSGPAQVLTPNYFCYKQDNIDKRVKYDPNTMRVFGVCKDGNIGFVTANNLDYLPVNSLYLPVVAGCPSEYKALETAQFTAGIESITTSEEEISYAQGIISTSGAKGIVVVNLSGQTVAQTYQDHLDVSNLPKGIYIALASGKSLKFMR